jgi:hypothetical protein
MWALPTNCGSSRRPGSASGSRGVRAGAGAGAGGRGRALRGRALRGRALRGRALRGRALRGRALRGRALRGRARRWREPLRDSVGRRVSRGNRRFCAAKSSPNDKSSPKIGYIGRFSVIAKACRRPRGELFAIRQTGLAASRIRSAARPQIRIAPAVAFQGNGKRGPGTSFRGRALPFPGCALFSRVAYRLTIAIRAKFGRNPGKEVLTREKSQHANPTRRNPQPVRVISGHWALG